MATDLGRVKSTSSSKYDAFVASQLAKAEGRIRLLDLAAGLLGFAALGLAYVVGMVLCDSKFELTQQTRQFSLYAFLTGSAIYLFFLVVRPLRLRVNPYYAARQVEQQLPEAKNSIVNWVDLHSQPLPPAIHGALGQRAAKDLSRVDLDRVISGRRAAWMGGLAGAGLAAFIVSFLLLGPSPFYSLLHRAFNPFGQVGVSTRTQLTILKPDGGNATVTVGRGVNFVVKVTGKVPDAKAPDAVKLLYRYEEGDPWLERLLLPEPSREWTTALSAIEVKNGFTYRITGGDAATEEYRVSVRAAPAITDFLATYHYRPYVARADEVHRERELKALRGTEVLLQVRTNRALREGRLEFEGKDGAKTVRGELADDDPRTLLVRFVLDEDGKYRLHFTSTDSEAYNDPISYSVTALPDKPPMVELTKPGQDIRLPADGMLHLEGKASDDIGVKALVLRLQVVGGETLRGQPYRSDDKLRLADGGYPRELEYLDFVELSRVKGEDGRPFPLRAGMELEYWLEASDACDYPRPNVSQSKHYRVMLTEPEKNEKKAQQEKKQAEQDKKQHEDKQDQKRQQEEQERQQERKEQEARNKEEQDKSNEADKGAAGDKNQPKEGDKQDKAEGQNNNGQQGENNPSKEQQDLENKIKDALDKKEQGENGQGEAKPDKGDQGADKGAQANNPGGGDKSEGEGKDKGQQGANQAGEGKDKGQPQPGADPQADGKGNNQPNPMPGDKGEAKGGNPMNQPSAGEAGEGKGKPEGSEKANDQSGGDAKGEAKGPGENKDDARAEAKQGGAAPMGDPAAQGEPKPSADAPKGERAAQGEAKPDAAGQARNATAKDIDDLAKKLQGEDAQRREEAKQQLEQIKKEARDPQARAKAEEALEQAGQPDGASEAKPTQPGAGPGEGNPMGEGKDGKGEDSKDAGAPKPEGGDKGQGDGDAKDAGKEGGQGTAGQQDSSPNGTAKESRNAEGGNTPGGGGNRRTGDNNTGDDGAPQSPPNKPSKPREHRAAQMQLEDFMKKVDKKVLKDAGVSEEAWRKYIEARRKHLAPPEAPRVETPANPQQALKLPSIGGRPIQPAASGPSGDTHAPDRGQPPPGYRDPFREFSRQMLKKNGEKKN
jgi:hypothetical protein